MMQRYVSPTMSTALQCPWHTTHRAQHMHPVFLGRRMTPFRASCYSKRQNDRARQRQRSSTAAASTDNGNPASADDQTFFATTPLSSSVIRARFITTRKAAATFCCSGVSCMLPAARLLSWLPI